MRETDSPSKNEIQKAPTEYEKFLEELAGLLERNDEQEIREYIDKRVESLVKKSEPNEFSLMGKSCTDQFIHPNSELKRSMMFSGIHIDDPDVYHQFIDEIQKTKKMMDSTQDTPIRSIIIYVIQNLMGKYFGNGLSYSDTEQRNRMFYMDGSAGFDDDEPQRLSIKQFKGEKMAVCHEKAALSQNLLSFTGLESNLILSSKSKLAEEGNEEAHAYNIITSGEKNFIFDPTNPSLVENSEGKIIQVANSAMYPISLEEKQKIMGGDSVKVEHTDFIKNDSGENEKKLSTRIYAGPSRP